jgi:hypothetical protein
MRFPDEFIHLKDILASHACCIQFLSFLLFDNRFVLSLAFRLILQHFLDHSFMVGHRPETVKLIDCIFPVIVTAILVENGGELA